MEGLEEFWEDVFGEEVEGVVAEGGAEEVVEGDFFFELGDLVDDGFGGAVDDDVFEVALGVADLLGYGEAVTVALGVDAFFLGVDVGFEHPLGVGRGDVAGLVVGLADGKEAGDGGVAAFGGVAVFFEFGGVDAELAGDLCVGGVGIHEDRVAL